MSERERLVKALNRYDDDVKRSGRDIYCPDVNVMADAARKHLATLPKTVTKWRVSHGVGASTWRVADTKDEAIDSAKCALVCGRQYVCIDEIQMPV